MSKRVAALLLMLGLTLNACSHRSASSVMPANGSPSGVPAGLIQRTGHIVLPAGSPIDPATLTVSNSLGSGRVSPSGGFALNAFPDGPQYAAVRNASGKLVMTAFLSDGEPDASVHSTAQTMLFFALGGFALPSTLQLQVLAQIGTLAKEQNLEGALSAALVSTGSDPLGSNKPAIGAAIQAVVTGVRPASAHRRPAGARRVPKGLTFDPSGQVSGLTMLADFPNAVHFKNVYRRAAEVYVDEVSPHAKTLSTLPLYQIPSVAPLKDFKGSIIAIVSGNFALSEIETSPPISLPAEPDADKTTYRLLVIGPGSTGPNTPALTYDQQVERTNLVANFFVLNQLVPLLGAILFPLGTKGTDSLLGTGATDEIRDIISVVTSSLPDVVTDINAGNFKDALLAAFNGIVTSNSLTSRVVNDVIKAAVANGTATLEQAATAGAANLASGIALFDILAGFADLAAVEYGVNSSNAADVFTVVSTNEKVTLTPKDPTLRNDDVLPLTASALNAAGSGQTVTYAYTNTATIGHLSDGVAGHQDNFSSNSATPTYTAGHTGQGSDTIAVTVFSTDPATNKKVTVGTASTTITVNGQGQVTLSSLTLKAGENGTITATVALQQTAISDFEFDWSAGGQLGHLLCPPNARGVALNDTCVDFRTGGARSETLPYYANQNVSGTENVAVEVFAVVNGKRTSFGRTTGTITVQEGKSLCNGDFEQGLACWTSTIVTASQGFPQFRLFGGAECDPGDRTTVFAMDVARGGEGILSQTFTVPANATTLSMRTWGGLQATTVSIRIVDAGVSKEIDIYSPVLLLSGPGKCSGSVPQTRTSNIAAYAGKTVTLQLDAIGFGDSSVFAYFDNITVN